MFLLINPISDPAVYILFDESRTIVDRFEIKLKGSESEQFFLSLEAFLAKQGQAFADLQGMIVISGPGGFTSMRIITLVANTISFVHGTRLYPVDMFSFASFAGARFPMLLKANRGEYLIQETSEDAPHIVPISEIYPGEYFGIAWENDFENAGISVQSVLDYEAFLRNFPLVNPVHRIEPIYIKKPNITIKKPND